MVEHYESSTPFGKIENLEGSRLQYIPARYGLYKIAEDLGEGRFIGGTTTIYLSSSKAPT